MHTDTHFVLCEQLGKPAASTVAQSNGSCKDTASPTRDIILCAFTLTQQSISYVISQEWHASFVLLNIHGP